MKYKIAVVGATGNVGREILRTLAESSIPIREVMAFASERSVGKEVSYGNYDIEVKPFKGFSFDGVDIAFFATDSDISKEYVPLASKKAKFVVDLSSYFRMHKDIPLIVPEVNPEALELAKKSKIISTPNCIVIPLVMALKKLDDYAEVSRVVVSTYQSVSGAGKKAMENLYSQTKSKIFDVFAEPGAQETIAFNIIPRIDDLTQNGYTKEEIKVIVETQKILSNDIEISPTCVRIPVFVGHSISANVEFVKNISAETAYDILSNAEGITTDKEHHLPYFTPLDCVGKKDVLVSRIRQDTAKNILNLWIVSDNLRKGAALNAVQAAEKYIEQYL
ncbi:aspartate-semialdehyde dehydrogenase [Candidatus Bandiella euplotis]|uniref:Aspartate-semialdehyde dehydrogenase n=1 Tax=Candidatus Bandiella euplotis TaxID=1664265 RepID=A0ABZ0UMM1_9RICK|nr:aspartate-semialdehyde dehydrogenase [Candidatus Bandiella woodruffii]WPX96964.1 Aspartate-semialdehyde dehydrogenase [Candidatus Bandiella woodruffii]